MWGVCLFDDCIFIHWWPTDTWNFLSAWIKNDVIRVYRIVTVIYAWVKLNGTHWFVMRSWRWSHPEHVGISIWCNSSPPTFRRADYNLCPTAPLSEPPECAPFILHRVAIYCSCRCEVLCELKFACIINSSWSSWVIGVSNCTRRTCATRERARMCVCAYACVRACVCMCVHAGEKGNRMRYIMH